MAAPTGAHVMRNASVKIDTTEYANQVTKVRLVPETPIQTMRTLVPDGVVQDVDSTVWTLELAGVQDWKTGGLAAALNTASGTEVDLVIVPKVGTGESQVTVTIIAMPVEFGGEQGNFRTFDASFPVVGTPTFGTAS